MKRILSILAILASMSITAFATDLALMPPIQTQETTNTGSPLAYGKVYTYEPGTTTPKATYLTSAGTTTNANPVILDSAGRASIWLNGTYKVKICTATDTQCRTVDNVSSSPALSLTLDEWITNSLVPTYLNATQFSVPGDYTATFEAGRRIKTVNSAGTYYGYITSSAYATSVTTVTVFLDSGALDSGLSAASVALLSADNHTVPEFNTVTKTGSATLTAEEAGKTILMNLSTSGTVTLPSRTLVPPGTRYTIKSIGTASVTIGATVDDQANPVLYQYDIARLVSDGVSTAWHGSIESETPAAHRVVRAKSTGVIDPDWFTSTVPYVISEITSSGTWTVPADINTNGDMFFFASGGGGCGGTGDVNGSGGGGGEGGKTWWYRHTGMVSGASYTATIGAGGVSAGSAGKCDDGTATSLVLASDATGTVFNVAGGFGGYSGGTGTAGTQGVVSYMTSTAVPMTPDFAYNATTATNGTLGAAGIGGRGAGRALYGTGGAAGAGNPGTSATGLGAGGGGGGYSAGAVNNGGSGYKGYIWYMYLRKIQ